MELETHFSSSKQPYQIILASASPRRRELLDQADFSFDIIPSKKEEVITKKKPSEVVKELASQKAEDVFTTYLDTHPIAPDTPADSIPKPLLVIGADTIVAVGNQILGKPENVLHAKKMLTLLSGKTHQVYTGVALYLHDFGTKKTKRCIFFEKTDVTFYEMDESEMDSYISTGDPLDKAGAYGIQGPCAVHIKEIHGDYNNVVGLPLARLYQEIKKL